MRERPHGIPISDLPPDAAAAAEHLRDALLAILGDDLVAMWMDGGTTFPDRPLVPGDLDVCVVVTNLTVDERDPGRWHDDLESRPARVAATQQALEREHGHHIDASYLVVDEMGARGRPGAAFFAARRDNGWPIVRAHWLAGQYVHLHGRRPEDLVVPPTEEICGERSPARSSTSNGTSTRATPQTRTRRPTPSGTAVASSARSPPATRSCRSGRRGRGA